MPSGASTSDWPSTQGSVPAHAGRRLTHNRPTGPPKTPAYPDADPRRARAHGPSHTAANHTAMDPSAPAKNHARRRHPEACARGAVPAPLRSARYSSCRCMRRRDRRSIHTARRLTCPLSLGWMSRPAPARSMSSRLLVSYTTLALDSPRQNATGAGRGLWYRVFIASVSQTCALT